jgi:transposase
MDKYYIKSDDWKKIYKFLQFQSGIRVKNEAKTRAFAEAVYCIMRTGAQWRELPSCYRKWRSIHKRFEQWSHKGLWNQIPLFIHITAENRL